MKFSCNNIFISVDSLSTLSSLINRKAYGPSGHKAELLALFTIDQGKSRTTTGRASFGVKLSYT